MNPKTRILRRYRVAALIGAIVSGAVLSPGVVQAAGHPNLSGVWGVFYHDHPGGRAGAPAEPALTKDGEQKVADFKAKYDVEAVQPGAYCVPGGMPTEMFGLGGYPVEIIQQPKRITMIIENEMQVRRIYMDGRDHPDDFPHTRGGHSIAHWEGDTLVVDTARISAWPLERWPHSGDAHVVEHISLKPLSSVNVKLRPGLTAADIGDTVLEDIVTTTDPMYDGPQTVNVYYRRLPDKETLEYDCAEGNWWDLVEATAKK
jgi:hypothetical protein